MDKKRFCLITPKNVLILVVAIIVFSAAMLIAAFQILKEKPTILHEPSVNEDARLPETDYTDDEKDEVSSVEIGNAPIETLDEITATRKEDCFTFLVVASDQSSGNADVIMVILYDAINKTVGMVSVPRDTLVDPISNPAKFPKINSSYHYGIDVLQTIISDLLGIPIDYYLTIDIKGFVKLVDAVGGVDFDIPIHMCYDDPLQNLSIHFEPGLQHLTGIDALGVCRLRTNQDGTIAYSDYDIGRTQTQQKMLKTIAKEVLSNPLMFEEYIDIFLKYCDTNLTFGNILWLAESAIGINMEEDVKSATLPGDGEVTCKGIKYCYQLYHEETLEIINTIINPYLIERTDADINIFSVS